MDFTCLLAKVIYIQIQLNYYIIFNYFSI